MEGNTEKLNDDWLKFLNEDEVKFQLMCASLYMTAYELLIDIIVNKTRAYFLEGLEDGELKYSKEYQSIKEHFPRDIVIASSLWLLNSNCINADDLDKIKEFKKYRNEIAHEMPKIISDTLHDVKTYYINDIRDLYRKINLWWFIEFEATINPNLQNINLDKLDYDEVLMFIMLPMNHMLNIINDEVAKRKDRINNLKKMNNTITDEYFYHVTPIDNKNRIATCGLLTNKYPDSQHLKNALYKRAQICFCTKAILKDIIQTIYEKVLDQNTYHNPNNEAVVIINDGIEDHSAAIDNQKNSEYERTIVVYKIEREILLSKDCGLDWTYSETENLKDKSIEGTIKELGVVSCFENIINQDEFSQLTNQELQDIFNGN